MHRPGHCDFVMTDLRASPLGHAAVYPDTYDPSLLYPVERAPLRAELGIDGAAPFFGEDIWTAYELSWLDSRGKPEVAIATLRIPAASPCIVESKSMKLYLTAFNQTRFPSRAEVAARIAADLGAATGARAGVELVGPEGFAMLPHGEPEGESLDDLPLATDTYRPEPESLRAGGAEVRETLHTRLFRSVCPVTGQPDYASVVVRYVGRALDRAGLLRYLVSFRRHPGFHEHCIERIYTELTRRCAPRELAVYARFTRRGGIDINPCRSSVPGIVVPNIRTARQ